MNAQQLLKETFGYNEFRDQQQAIIDGLVNGRDTLVLMPTGGGKSLCYQIPSILRPGTGIVISPLIALMQDQVDALVQYGVAAAYLNSSLEDAAQHEIEQKLINGELELLYITPERLLSPRMLALIDRANPALFAIDEAHCVSQWGHDFRPEYQQLKVLHQRFPSVPRVALTATADRRTRDEIIEQLDLTGASTYISSFDRPNIHYQISDQNNRDALWQFIETSHRDNAGIIYCLSRRKVEEIAQWLCDKGREALPYHAGLSQQERETNQRRFLREQGLIIVATIAFGMGIDKPDVRFVAHLNLPKSIEAYYQETGRAGRDGLSADAWLSYSTRDLITLRQMNDDTTNPLQQRITNQKLDALVALCETTRCRRHHLLSYFDEHSSEHCGNCDTCLNPPETWDATEAARKALSCVYRTGQRFGVGYLVDVLVGKEDERITQYGHDKISTYGIGKEHTLKEWRDIFRQLIGRGYLDVNSEQYGALYLTEAARPLLRGETELLLRKQKKTGKQRSGSAGQPELRQIDQPLFEALRQRRMEIAQQQSVPPYVIFHDKTLLDMCRLRPASVNDLRLISGIGEKKLEQYGDDFLEVISRYPVHPWLINNLSDTINETLSLYAELGDIEEVATRRDLTSSTAWGHLAKAVENDVIALSEISQITEQEIELVNRAIEITEAEGNDSRKAIYTMLDGEIDYGKIECVRASRQVIAG